MKVRVSAVSYINTLPFLYGLEQMNDEIELILDYPALTAKRLVEGSVDIGLVPVVVLNNHPDFKNISDFCIGADGKVASVLLISDFPLKQIKSILLDYQSQTSNNLTRILAKFYWKIKPIYGKLTVGLENLILSKSAAVLIGDKAFKYRGIAQYEYDLAEEWKKFTGLPFVFALWVANKQLPNSFVEKFNQALEIGLNNIDKVLTRYKNKIADYQKFFDIKEYLTHYISYDFSAEKQKGLNKFFYYLNQL